MKPVGDVANQRTCNGVQQACDRKDGCRLYGSEATEGRVEEENPTANDSHRTGAQQIVGAVRKIMTEADLTSLHARFCLSRFPIPDSRFPIPDSRFPIL